MQQYGSITIKGVVKDANGEPVIGASVKMVGGKAGTITDVDGRFAMQVKPGASVEVSYIGYLPETFKAIQNAKDFNITLREDSKMLNEVVAIGYGTATKKKDLSAAIGVVSNVDELAVRPVTSTEGMLQGQLAGVTVTADGGDPTANPNIVIRGQGSQNGDNVLWVVDGVPGAPIASLNDIESIVVLKDAASAAIYGAQSGAGGVVLVTTKKAKKGQTSISYDGMVGIRNAMNLPTPLNAEQEIEMRKRSYASAGMNLPTGWDVTKNPWVGTTRTNWMDEVFRTAFYQRHNVALSTGNETSTNRLSFATLSTRTSHSTTPASISSTSGYPSAKTSYGRTRRTAPLPQTKATPDLSSPPSTCLPAPPFTARSHRADSEAPQRRILHT